MSNVLQFPPQVATDAELRLIRKVVSAARKLVGMEPEGTAKRARLELKLERLEQKLQTAEERACRLNN